MILIKILFAQKDLLAVDIDVQRSYFNSILSHQKRITRNCLPQINVEKQGASFILFPPFTIFYRVFY